EVLTWAQLKLHNKPIIILNVSGFWDPLIELINHLVENGFADQSLNKLFKVVSSPGETIEALKLIA
ncbi:MAG: LOG family protein, partial [Paracoccaceae bacterium]